MIPDIDDDDIDDDIDDTDDMMICQIATIAAQSTRGQSDIYIPPAPRKSNTVRLWAICGHFPQRKTGGFRGNPRPARPCSRYVQLTRFRTKMRGKLRLPKARELLYARQAAKVGRTGRGFSYSCPFIS